MDEEIDIVDELEAGAGRQEPPMLKILCILTWVYTFFSCFIFALSFISIKNISIFFSDFNGGSFFWLFTRYFVAPLICALGALLMWNKNKWGFVIYVIAQITPVAHAFYLTIFVLGIKGPGVFFTIIMNLIPLAFIVFYALQLPYFKPLKKKELGSI